MSEAIVHNEATPIDARPWDSVDACDATGWNNVVGQVYCWRGETHDGPHYDLAAGWWTVKETTDDH